MLTDPQFWALLWTVISAAAGGLVIAFGWLVKKAWPKVRDFVRFVDQWHGSPTQPGVLARLSALEAELKPNGGKSLKDQITSMTEQLSEIGQKLQTVDPNSTD